MGFSISHEVLVVEGGNLLLLGNDFLARYQAKIELTNDADGVGYMWLTKSTKGREQKHRVELSCKAPSLVSTAKAASVATATPAPSAPRLPSEAPNLEPHRLPVQVHKPAKHLASKLALYTMDSDSKEPEGYSWVRNDRSAERVP